MDEGQHSTLSEDVLTTKQKNDKPPHDASVFVGRLVYSLLCTVFKVLTYLDPAFHLILTKEILLEC